MPRSLTIYDIKQSACAERNKHLFADTGNMIKKRSKFGNTKIEIDGYTFDSLKESRRYIQLKTMQVYGQIINLIVHPVFELSICKYYADFSYMQNGNLVVEDVKSKVTRKLSTYRMKKKLMAKELNIEITEI